VAFTRQALGVSTYAAPRTILGFFGIVLLLVVSGAVAAIGFLARHTGLYYLIPDILLGSIAFAVLELVAVIGIALVDPTRLMLGQMTGTEFIEHRRLGLLLGDSAYGERLELRPVQGPLKDPAPADDVGGATGAQG
jgi:hypothetical protein